MDRAGLRLSAGRSAAPAHGLYRVDELRADKRFPARSAREEAAISATARWLEEYISRPDPAVGRSGDVCPWTRRTLQLGNLSLTSITDSDPSQIQRRLLRFLTVFERIARHTPYAAIVTVFPELESRVIVAVHEALKPTFLRNRMMLGEFYPTCPKPGVHNPDYKPLRSEYPLFVIRWMVDTDVVFLIDREEFAEAYLDAFGVRGAKRLLNVLEERASQLPPEHAQRLHGCAVRRLALDAT